MNIGRVVSLNRQSGSASVAVVEEDQIYRIELGPREVNALDASVVMGAPICVEWARQQHGSFKLLVHRRGAQS